MLDNFSEEAKKKAICKGLSSYNQVLAFLIDVMPDQFGMVSPGQSSSDLNDFLRDVDTPEDLRRELIRACDFCNPMGDRDIVLAAERMQEVFVAAPVKDLKKTLRDFRAIIKKYDADNPCQN